MANPIKSAKDGVTKNDGGAAAFAAALATVILISVQWGFDLEAYPAGLEAGIATLAAAAVAFIKKALKPKTGAAGNPQA